jgi:hypothetical protein
VGSGGPEPAGSTEQLDLSERREAPAAAGGVRPHSAPEADLISRGQAYLSRTRNWFSRRSAWVKVLLVLLLIGLLPWLLLATGLTITGIGLVGLRRGSLPAFRLSSRAAATGAVLVGLVTLVAGSGLAASVVGLHHPPATGPCASVSASRSSTASGATPSCSNATAPRRRGPGSGRSGRGFETVARCRCRTPSPPRSLAPATRPSRPSAIPPTSWSGPACTWSPLKLRVAWSGRRHRGARPEAELKRFYVVPDARGTGVASALLQALVEYARGSGVRVLRLETGDEQHAAIRFYRKHGFAEIRPFSPYPTAPPPSAWSRWCPPPG